MNSVLVFGFLSFVGLSLAQEVSTKPQEAQVNLGEAIVSAIFNARDRLVADCRINDELPDCSSKIVVSEGTKLFHVFYDKPIQKLLDYIHSDTMEFELFIELIKKKIVQENSSAKEVIDYFSNKYVTRIVKKLFERIYNDIKDSSFGRTMLNLWTFVKSFEPKTVQK